MASPAQARLVTRLVLGTAALGSGYGRRRGAPPLPASEVCAILDAAWDAGIRAFDTATSYGDAAAALAHWLRTGGRLADAAIVTKVTAADALRADAVAAACHAFQGARELTVLSHGAVDADAFALLRGHAASVHAAAGQSVYTATEVASAAAAGAARVQAPVNVFDPRQADAARRAAVPLDGRSVFLQGLLLDDDDVAGQRVRGGGALARAVRHAALDAGLDPAGALIAAAALRLGPADRLVIGIDEVAQLEAIHAAADAAPGRVVAFAEAIAAATVGDDVLDPRTWP